MFRSLLQALRKKNLMVKALEITDDALAKAEMLTRAAVKDLVDSEKPSFDVYAVDREINQAEIHARQLVFEHMLIHRDTDITPALIIASTIIDIERIGDYAKNIYELSERYPHPFEGNEHFTHVRALSDEILKMFGETARAFKRADEAVAASIMREHSDVGRRCEQLIDRVVADSNISARDAVVIALSARFLKRVSAHLSNIASSVVNPFDRIGFRPSTDPPEDADM